MNLGIIGWIDEESFKKAKERDLKFIELDVNSSAEEFLAHVEQVKEYSKRYEIPIQAVGRWGTTRITEEGISQQELELECRLIDAASELGCGIYITGCNYIDSISYYENCQLAIAYFEKLIAYGKDKNVKIATYNCRWNNFVCTPTAYTIIHGYLKDLYIKYDASHAIYDGADYIQETKDWGDRFVHVHLKGVMVIDGKRYDDPPAGMDQIDWPAYIALLYVKGYNGGLSIEPHSEHWKGELGEKAIDFTVNYFKQFIL